MINGTNLKGINSTINNVSFIGFCSAILMALFSAVSFGIAVFTPPISGPFCTGTSIKYPYTDIISRFPRDYFWMYPAIIFILLFVVLMLCINQSSSKETKIFGQIGLLFAIISAAILITDYFIQISVIQPSLLNGELDSIAILTQYNPHGVFIALEEIGYLLMSISFICVVPIFSGTNKLQNSIRWVYIIGFILTIISFILISIFYGINREYRFEVSVIMIDYLTLTISGILLSIMFKKTIRIAA